MSTRNLVIDDTKSVFILDTPIKNTNAGEPYICLVHTLEHYLSVTQNLRPVTEERLFLSFKKPHKNVTAETISRWAQRTMETAGLDTNIFKNHSTRSATVSAVKKNGICDAIIMKTVGWRNAAVFGKFYDKYSCFDVSDLCGRQNMLL